MGANRAAIAGASLRASLLATSAVALMGLATPAAAQEPAPAEAVSTLEDVVVTASRTGASGFAAPSPTTVVSAQTIERQGATSIAQVLSLNPAFKATQSASANSTKTQNPGAATADLRALGAQRTLVLVNGMRATPAAPVNMTGATVSPDLNIVPPLLIDRVEVVTGGASAQWGSDAVAGVINILLNNRFEGLQLTAQAGKAEAGDMEDTRFGALAGAGFLSGNGHIVLGVDYDKNKGMGDIYTRDWGREEVQIVANPSPATNGQPALILAKGVHTTLAAGGVITAPATFSLRNYTFNADGTVRPFQLGAFAGSALMVGGEGASIARGITQSPAIERYSTYLHAEYDLTQSMSLYGELSYADSRALLQLQPGRSTAITIRNDNPYLPAAVRTAMAAQNITSFTMARINYDSPRSPLRVENRTPHGVVGIRGTVFGDWDWDIAYARGRNTFSSKAIDNLITRNLGFAADAVVNPANGQIVCRAVLPGASFNAAAAGCVPANLFGPTSVTPEMARYINGTALTRSIYDQENAAANVRGDLFSTWAGPVSVGAGLEYRKESQVVTADPIAASGGFATSGNGTPFTGEFDVKEGYVEAVVPLARDQAFARSLDFNGAVRVADYSTVGSQTTWKVGAVYEPFSGLRLRATRSRDIRAPALFELYSQGAPTGNVLTVRGVSANVQANTTGGNPNLQPEVGDTLTLGGVLEFDHGPFDGLRLSVDYYDIDLKEAITSLSGANIASLCNLGQEFYCGLFTFNPTTRAPLTLNAGALNAASLQTIGYDIAASYDIELSRLFASAPGRLSTALTATYVTHSYVDLGTGAGPIDRAGESGQANAGAIPHLRMNLSETYSAGPASLTAQVVFVGKSKIDNTYNTTPATTINDNSVPAIGYLNLYGSYELGKNRRVRLFAAIDNAFDQDPPPVPYVTLNAPTNGQFYDKVGRAFRLGVTFRH